MDNLVNFLKFCVKRESEGKINPLNTQNNFNKFLNEYQNSDLKNNAKYKEILDAIVDTHDVIINKKDESSMDYIENNYETAKSLVLSSQKKGYNLTEEDNVTKLNSAAFITTTIILDATAVLYFIFMLLALVK